MEQLYFKRAKGVRVRYAPSPTGPLHIGGARTALFDFLFARKHQGALLLRIEDTDPKRSQKKWEKNILDSLKWLGIVWDEGPMIEDHKPKISTLKEKIHQRYIGDYGPYRQSEREEVYKKYIQKLFDQGYLYWCFCKKEELEAQKDEQLSRGEPPHYTNRCRTLIPLEIEKFKKENRKGVLRFKVPSKLVNFKDAIRGKIEVDTSLWGDIVVAKSFKEPLYNLACVIDDFEMQITHVIRGEDHLSNTPKQILIQEALGFPKVKYAHLPLILGPDKSKLSKRHGAVSIEEYKTQGYLPEAMVNFMVFLGWNPDTNEEIFSLEELTQRFSLERVQKSGAIFNLRKLDWLNGWYLRQKSLSPLVELCLPYFIKAGFLTPVLKKKERSPKRVQEFIIQKTKEKVTFEWIERVVFLFQERLKKISEISELSDFFFKKSLDFDSGLLIWKEAKAGETKRNLKRALEILENISKEDWTRDKIKEELERELEKEPDKGYYLWPLRVALTGKKASPPPFDIAKILGREKCLWRVKEAIELLKNS